MLLCFRPGPSAPLPWVRECVLQLAPHSEWREKILLGINMYGLDFSSQGGAEPLLGERCTARFIHENTHSAQLLTYTIYLLFLDFVI